MANITNNGEVQLTELRYGDCIYRGFRLTVKRLLFGTTVMAFEYACCQAKCHSLLGGVTNVLAVCFTRSTKYFIHESIMASVNCGGRSYSLGKPLSLDYRTNIVDPILDHGCDSISGHFDGHFKDVASEYKVRPATFTKIWKQYCETDPLAPKHGGGKRIKWLVSWGFAIN